MIITKEFQLTPQQHFRISLKFFLLTKKKIIFYLIWFLAIFLITLVAGDFTAMFFWFAFVLLYFIFLILYVRHFSYSEKNKIFFRKVRSEIDNNFINSTFEDGSKASFNWSNILEVNKDKTFFMLFVSKQQFLYLPFEAFKSTQDLDTFENILREKELLK